MNELDRQHRPVVSVVLPCFNYGHLLPVALESVLRQTYPKLHVLVVDDGSTDGTRSVAAAYQGKVEYVSQPNAGLPSARNLGAARAHGPFLLFLDPDDTLEPSYIEECVGILLENDQIAYAYTQVRFFGDRQGISQHPEFSLEELKKANYIHASALLRTSLVRRFPYDPSLTAGWEDWDFYLTLAEHGYTGKLLDKPLLNYRRHSSNMTGRLSKRPLDRKNLQLKIHRRHPGLYTQRQLLLERLRILRLRLALMLRISSWS